MPHLRDSGYERSADDEFARAAAARSLAHRCRDEGAAPGADRVARAGAPPVTTPAGPRGRERAVA